MAGRSQVSASAEQRAELEELALSGRQDEADRVRAMLLSLAGWTSEAIAAAFGVTADSVRHWRQWYPEGGVEGFRTAIVPGLSGEGGLQALAIAATIWAPPKPSRQSADHLIHCA